MTSQDKRQSSIAAIAMIVLATFGSFLFSLAQWLWGRDHYQYFPLVIVAAVGLAIVRLKTSSYSCSPAITLRSIFWLLLSLLLFSFALLDDRNWVGSVAALCYWWGLVLTFDKGPLAEQLRGPTVLLCLAIPLPLNLDQRLIVNLQLLASSLASEVLDLIGIRHVLSGVGIVTDTRSFMVEDACSGVHSLFSCICAVVFVCVLRRSSAIRFLILICLSAGWVLVANVLRVVVIVWGYANWGLELDSGRLHDLLGVMTYGVAVFLSLSTDHLLFFLVPVTRTTMESTGVDYIQGSDVLTFWEKNRRRWNRFRRTVFDSPLISMPRSRIVLLALFAVVFAPLSVFAWGRLAFKSLSSGSDSASVLNPLAGQLPGTGRQSFDAALLPTSLGEWQLSKSEVLDRNPDDPRGVSSTVFHYAGNGLVASFSIDGYYNEWHDLAYCYTGLGMKLKSQSNFVDEQTGHQGTRLELYTDTGDLTVASFSCFDSQFQSVTPGIATLGVSDTLRQLLDRLPWIGTVREDRAAVNPPVFQLQLVCTTRQELLDHERQSLEQLFADLSSATLQGLKGAAP